MANEMRKTAIIVSVLVILVAAPHASMAVKDLDVTVDKRSSPANPVGVGFPAGEATAPWEGAEALQIKISAADPMDIASASVHLYEAVLWVPTDWLPPDPWIFETAGILPDEAFAVIFRGNLKRIGGGKGGGEPPDWGAAVSDIDIDCDSDNDSTADYPEPETGEGAVLEDAIECAVGSSSTEPPGMAMAPGAGWAQLRVTGHAKRSGFMSLQVGGDASKFVIADSNFNPVTPPDEPKVSAEPGYTIVYEEDVDEAQLLNGTFYVKPKSEGQNPAEDGDHIGVTAIFGSESVVDEGVASGTIVADEVLVNAVDWSLGGDARIVMVEADGNYDAPDTGDPPYNPAKMKKLIVNGPPGDDFVLKRTFLTMTPKLRVFESDDGTGEVTFTDHQSDPFEIPQDGHKTFWVKGLEQMTVPEAHNDASANKEDQGIEVWLTEGNPTEAKLTSKWTAFWLDLDLTVPKTQPAQDTDDKLAGAYIHTGVNGICDTTAAEADDDPIKKDKGRPKAKAITPGTDGTIETKEQPDDVKVGNVKIHTGDNGICDTKAEDTDVPLIDKTKGQKYQQCIRAVVTADNENLPSIVNMAGTSSLGLIGEGEASPGEAASPGNVRGLRYAVQVEGSPYPPAVAAGYKMCRQVKGMRIYKKVGAYFLPRTGVHTEDDHSLDEFVDDTEGSPPKNRIYDYDAAGAQGTSTGSAFLRECANDATVAIRGNFVQWAEAFGERCSRKLPWFMRRAANKDGGGQAGVWSAVHVCEEDNKVGEEATGLGWDAKALNMTVSLKGEPTPPKDEGDGTFTAIFTAKVQGGKEPYTYVWTKKYCDLEKLDPHEPNKRKGTFKPDMTNVGKHSVRVSVLDSTADPRPNLDAVALAVFTNTPPVVAMTHRVENDVLKLTASLADKEGDWIMVFWTVKFLNAQDQQISKEEQARVLMEDMKKTKKVPWNLDIPANTKTIEVHLSALDWDYMTYGAMWVRFPK